MTRNFCISPICLVAVLLFVQISVQLSLNEFLSVNKSQKLKLDAFRELMVPQLPHDHMKQDSYLIKWLRDNNFDVAAAQGRLLNHVKWREENNMDSILYEDWTEFDDEFRQYMEGCTMDGKAVISVRLGDWDFRKYVISGRAKKLMRFVDKMFEEGEIIIRRMQEDGQNVTQSIQLFDLNNFNLVQQGCPRCLAVFFHIINTYNTNYPGNYDKSYLINMPRLALPIWELLRNALEPKFRDTVFIFGKDKSSWSSVLFKEMKRNQLSVTYGGTKLEATDYEELRATGEPYRCKDHLLKAGQKL